MTKSKLYGLLTITMASIVVLFFHYRPYIVDPNNAFFNLYGDGYKNYYTVYYHVKHDSTYSHFEGMNYPYGEHVMYTDGQPVLANTLKFISQNIVDISDYTVPIMNIAMIVSFLLCSILLYLILTRLGVSPWFAAIAGLGIMLMSPQHFRAISHFSLAYAFIIPLVIYLMLRFEEKASFATSVLIGMVVGISGLLHMYHLAILGMMIGWYFLFSFLRKKSWKRAFEFGLHYAIQVIIPFLLIQIWVMSTDFVTDRSKTPMGFLDYRARWEGILTSAKLPYWAWVDKNVVDIRDMSFESEIYLGIVGIIGFFAFLRPLFRKQLLKSDTGVAPRFLNLLFPGLLLMLLISLGLPFIIPGLDFLIDYVGPYRQFRGQGRFAWVFYYGWSILLWYLLHQKMQEWWGNRRLIWIVLAILAMGMESFFMSQASFVQPWKDEALYNRQKFETSPKYWFKDVKLLDYQAVLPLPYYHNGSENFVINTPGDAVRFTTLAGWHYGMENLGVELSRTSFSQTFASIQLNLLPYRPYQIVKKLPYQKPLLVVLDNAQYFSFLQGSRYLLQYSKILQVDSLVQIRELPLEAFDLAVESWRQEVKTAYESTLPKGFMRDGFLLPDSAYQFYYETFDQLKSPHTYRGKGAFVGKGRRSVPFITFQTPAANNECSVWVYLGGDQRPRMNFKGYEVDVAGNERFIIHNSCRMDMKVLDNNGWGLVVFPINVSRPGATVRIELEYRDMSIRDVYIDEFLVRPVGRPEDNIYWRKGNELVFNNFWFPKMF